MTSDRKPLFIPVMKKYYFMLESGEQDCEIRPCGHRGWRTENVFPGRLMTLSNGYGKYNRVTKEITRAKLSTDLKVDGIPQWHIDAVTEIYGHQPVWLVAYVEKEALIPCRCSDCGVPLSGFIEEGHSYFCGPCGSMRGF